MPSSARTSGVFAVVGFDVAGGDVLIGGVGAIARNCSADERALALPGQEVVCAQVPPGAGTGRLEVRTVLGGPSYEVITFVVLSGPVIYEVRPNPAARDVPVTIVGDGFDTTDTGGMVTVEFEGATPVQPTRVRDRSIDVTVPAGAITGAVRVHHPAGTAVSARDLIIDDGSPLIYDFDHSLIEAGDTLVLFGRHLAGVTQVQFSGGAAGTGATSTDGQVSVTVPAGVDPGPITVTVTAGQAASGAIAVLEREPPILAENITNGIGLSASEGSLYALSFSGPPELIIVDTTSGDQSRVPVGGATGLATYFGVVPDGTRGLVYQPPLGIHVIDLPSGTLVGTCPRYPTLGGAGDAFAPRTDDRGRYAFTRKPVDSAAGEEGFLRIDLSDGSCEFFVTATTMTGNGVQGVLFDPVTGDLLVSHSTVGHWYADVETGLPTTPSLGMPAFGQPQLFRGLAGPNRIYALGAPGSGLAAVDLFSGRAPDILHTQNGLGAQTKNGRWVFVGLTAGTGYFVDLLSERIARDAVPSVRGESATPGVSSFFINTGPLNAEQIQAFRIRD